MGVPLELCLAVGTTNHRTCPLPCMSSHVPQGVDRHGTGAMGKE